jgi:peroxiredoxin
MRSQLALSCLLLSAVAFAQEGGLAEKGQPAPAFRLPVYNGKDLGVTMLGLDRYTGYEATDKNAKIVVLSFMASFCAPCKKEMPYLESLHEKYKDQGLRIVMVSIDTEPEGQKIIDELIAKNKVTFPVLKDRFNIVARRWLGSKSPLPSVFFVKPDGTVSNVHRGYNEEASQVIEAEILAAVGAKPATATKPIP